MSSGRSFIEMTSVLKIKEYLQQKVLSRIRGFDSRFNLEKKALIDYAFQDLITSPPYSFIDLGGVWGVDGAYTFYTLDQYAISRAVLVDTDFTEHVLERSKKYTNLELITGNFGDHTLAKQLGNVDAIFLFDVLLHQVKPDWDEILGFYAPITSCFIVFNQQFTGSDTTIRLLDLGEERYFENVPHDRDCPPYDCLFEKMYEIHPQHDRIWRDIHNIWQWGITNRDLRDKMKSLRFVEKYHKDCGQIEGLANFRNHAFVFERRQ